MTGALRAWYRGRRVFVTGHTGFKGAWLTAWLRDAGATVTGYALPPDGDRPCLFDLAGVGDGVETVLGDVRDGEALEAALRAAVPEVVFHLAAQALVRRSYDEPVSTFETNVMGTARLLDAVRRVPSARAVVVVTSDKCYENRELPRGFREDDPMGGHDPYSASKGCAELVTAAFRRSFLSDATVAVASARAGNVIGGGDWSDDRLVPDLMRAAADGRAARVRNPEAVRPWQFVLEPLRGYLMLGRALAECGDRYADGWNFGPRDDEAVPVREVVRRMTVVWPRIVADVTPDATGPREARTLRLDYAKAERELGWAPVLTLDDTVDLTVSWYRAVAEDRRAAASLVLEQLHDYEHRADGAGTER
jgi:CDP-glucose 4,6-dehydratase